MKSVLKILIGAVVAVLILLILTNPTLRDFKEFTGEEENESIKYIQKKESNYLIFSEYSLIVITTDGYKKDYEKTKYYLGIFKNFYRETW